MRAFNGERLKEARYYNSLSISDLADQLGVSKQMVSKYENGKSTPGAEVLFKIIQVLKFPSEFYFQKDEFDVGTSGTFYRSRLTSTQKQKAPSESIKKALVIYRDYLEEYVEFPTLVKPYFENIEQLIEEKNFDEIAEKLREFWDIGNDPIPNLMYLLEERGFVIGLLPTDMKKVDAFSSQEQIKENNYYVILSKKVETSFFRQQFSLAHELGHWLMHSDLIDPQHLDTVEYREKESDANEFASSFLLPKSSFLKDLTQGPINLSLLASLKGKWHVAIGALLMRAYKLDAITEEQYVKMQKQISYHGWRKVEPLDDITEKAIPLSLRQATELLVDNNVVSAAQIPEEIQKRYNRAYPISMLEEVASLEPGYLSYKDGEVVKLRP